MQISLFAGDLSTEGQTFGFYKIMSYVTTSGLKTARWWASHEQLRLNNAALQAISGDPEGLCELREKMGRIKLASSSASDGRRLQQLQGAAASYAAITQSSECDLSAGRRSLAMQPDAQSCANACRDASLGEHRCTIFLFFNSGAAAQAPCYWIFVSQASDCTAAPAPASLSSYTLTGADAPQPPHNVPPTPGLEGDGAADDDLSEKLSSHAFASQKLNMMKPSNARRHRSSASRPQEQPGTGLVSSTSLDGIRYAATQAEAAAQLSMLSASEPFLVNLGDAGFCEVQCARGYHRVHDSANGASSPHALPSTTQKLSLALSSMTSSRKVQDDIMAKICPAVFDSLPDFVKDICRCVPAGAFGFIFICTVEVPNPLSETDEPLFTLTADLSFAPCANTPNFGFNIMLDGWDEHSLAFGPYVWDGEVIPVAIPGLTWGLSFFGGNSKGGGSSSSGSSPGTSSPGGGSWILRLLKGLTLEAGAVFTLRLEGNLKRTVVDVGLDLCAVGPFGLGEFCLGDYETTSEMFHVPFYFLEVLIQLPA